MSFLYPNVPLAIAGVPAVLRRAQALEDAQETLAEAQDDVTTKIAAYRWGIFSQAGISLLEADSVVSVEHSAEFRIADYPVEGGAFESYDKVATPFIARVVVSKGGTVAEREQFLADCQRLVESLDACNIVTPERTYLDVNTTRIGMTRNSSNGAGMIAVELVLQEIRQAAKAAYSKTNAPETEALAAAPAQAAPPVTAAPKTTKRPAAVRKTSQGSVQSRRVTVSGATLTTTTSGRKLYVYDRPPVTR